ncbi:Carbon monoxide oxidation accessory protein CoxG [hydrothermal vent metagenome]|uniref:Carbon monoxide oxidation accessory protein CoxG n=1 Tax=hydrothermal vent metagenome TaxID=652676 RepID=A0A3B0SY09_9ZZZZ
MTLQLEQTRMKMSGEHVINAGREAVWEALNDPAVLKDCIPGCQEITKISDTEMQAVVLAKVGPVKAKFKGKIKLSDLDPPNGYTITGEGSGGAAGFAKGGAKVALEDVGGKTRLTYEVDAQIGGKLAQIGQRLIDGTAKKMAGDFFTKFAARFEAPVTVEEAVDEMVAEAAPDMADIDRRADASQKWLWILAGLAVLGMVASQFL